MNLDTYEAYKARRVAALITYTNASPDDREDARIALDRATKAERAAWTAAWEEYIGSAR